MEEVQYKLEQIKKKREWLDRQFNRRFILSPVEEIAETKWFKQSDTPIFFDIDKKMFTSDLPDGKHAYLSYYEKNTNFSMSPSETVLRLNGGQNYTFTLQGEKDRKIGITLVVIQYSNEQKIITSTLSLNESKKVYISPETDNVRVGLKITGKGSFRIQTIRIDDILLFDLNNNSRDKYKLIEGTQWYIPNTSDIEYYKFTSTFSVNLEEGKYAYLPYKEGNVNFSDAPSNPIDIKDRDLFVIFEGEKNSSVDVRLFLIFYKQNKKSEVVQLNLNSRRRIQLSEEIDKMRIAIRVSGMGNFSLSTVAISGVGYWLPISFRNPRTDMPKYNISFKIDKPLLFGLGRENKILYHPYQDIFESKLVGKQFVYLPCFENIGVNEPPRNSLLTPKPKHYYEFFVDAEIFGDAKLTLFVVGFKNDKRIELHQIPFNQRTTIEFNEAVNKVKAFIRVSGKGYFRSIYLGIDENPFEVTNSLDLDLNCTQWFQSGKYLMMSNDGESLIIKSNIPDGKKVYMSYKEKNNNFSIPPLIKMMPVRDHANYEILIKAVVDEELEIIPMLIGYAGKTKVQVTQLKLNSLNVIKFDSDVTDFRIAIRIAGTGQLRLESFSIQEIPAVQSKTFRDWVSEQELAILKIVPPKPLKKLKMAVIFDEFTKAAFQEECELITFSPENWFETLSVNKPDLLMVESAWQGNGGSWNKSVGYYGEENLKPLLSLLKWCNENNIPTVFWNKEDPVHFDRFIETAKKFDYIFTTDENMIPKYVEHAGHTNVFVLPFAAQPKIHNPIKIVEKRENKACFAGSYYRHHEERTRDMDRIFDCAAKYGLEIFDRNYEKTRKGLMPNHRFPERFEPYIKGSLKYYEIDKAYKGYSVMINVNTVKHSPTMFSRRVFEGLACGTPIVSTYAEGIKNIFGDLVYISEDEHDIDQAFNTLLNDNKVYRKKSMLGIREVLSKHTYTHRLKYIVDKVGLNFKHTYSKVTVIAFAKNKEEFFQTLEQFNRQEYKNKELFVLIDIFDGYLELFNKYNTESVKTFIRSYMHKYQNILEWIDSPYITYFSNNDYYGRNYLLDLMLCTTFTDSDFIGKGAYFYYDYKTKSINEYNTDAEYSFVPSLMSSRSIMKTEVFSNESLKDFLLKLENNYDLGQYLKYGKTMFSNDKYNYLADVYSKYKPDAVSNIIQQIEI
jgi:spore maturation protein CgeB